MSSINVTSDLKQRLANLLNNPGNQTGSCGVSFMFFLTIVKLNLSYIIFKKSYIDNSMFEVQKQFLNLNQPSQAGSRVIGQIGLTLFFVTFSSNFFLDKFSY